MAIHIFFNDCWGADQISVTETTSTRLINPEIETKCLDEWNSKLAIAQEQGKLLWDSEVYRFEEVINSDKKNLTLCVSTIPFSIRLGMNTYTDSIKQMGLSFAPQGLFTSVLSTTSDGFYVFIEKSDRYFTTKKYSWIGGVLSKSEHVITSGKDLCTEVQKEIFEEIAIEPDHIDGEVQLRAGYRTDNWNVCLLFAQKIKLTAADLQKHFSINGSDEAKSLLMIHPNELAEKITLFESKDQEKFAILDLI